MPSVEAMIKDKNWIQLITHLTQHPEESIAVAILKNFKLLIFRLRCVRWVDNIAEETLKILLLRGRLSEEVEIK
jgi:hypothetical protein